MQYIALLAPLLLYAVTAAVPHVQQLLASTTDVCDCSGTRVGNSSEYICRDERLGPVEIPRLFPLLSFVSDYDRFGGKPPGEFLAKWTNATTGKYVYPPHDGYCLDQEGRPIVGNMTLKRGTKVDRFGSEFGSYVSAADALYNQRALPPNNLNHPPGGDYPFGYHIYTVAKDLVVAGGPIAPWFGQPGLGAQFYVGHTGNIGDLIRMGYLARVNISTVEPGPGNGTRGCGL